jgi:UDP-GlcNAc3NAcA epimerase
MPEESNRYVSDRLASLNFACTYPGMDNLLKEGMPAGSVHNTGDLMLDAALKFAPRAKETSTLVSQWFPAGQPFVLATIHRAENTDDPHALAAILRALHRIHADIPVVFPVHPRTRQVIDAQGMELRLITTPPLGYLDMLALVQAAGYVVTDSGGLSREAFFFQKPSVIVMKQMFWPEISLHGPSLSTIADTDAILTTFRALQGPLRSFDTGVFGDGHAAEKIGRLILNHLHG